MQTDENLSFPWYTYVLFVLGVASAAVFVVALLAALDCAPVGRLFWVALGAPVAAGAVAFPAMWRIGAWLFSSLPSGECREGFTTTTNNN